MAAARAQRAYEVTMIHLDADSVIEGIVQWCSRLRDIKDDAAFEIAWTETWAWITDPLRAATLNALLDGNEHPGMCELLPPFQRRWLAIKERKEAEHLISSPWGANAVARDRVRAGFGRLTYDRVRELFDLVELGSCRKFVMVGCGAFPAAILLVRDLTSVPDLIALDVEFEAATMAQRVIDAIGDHRIHVHRIDGADYSYVGANVIYIANHVCSKARSIERVRDSAPQDAVVIVREPYGVGRLVAETVVSHLPSPYRVAAIGANHGTFYSRHVRLARDEARTSSNATNV